MAEAINPDYDPTGIEGGVDTNVLPWMAVPGAEGLHLKALRASNENGMFSVVVNPGLPDIALKILRVSAETGVVSLVVRHNGVADPHNHLAASDFLVLNGRIGYRAGPPEGYGPGVWFFEPAGARHDATQRLTDDDLIYMANVYGPLTFDSGRGTPIAAVLSWMEYEALANAGAGA